jgi:hypothetical protein
MHSAACEQQTATQDFSAFSVYPDIRKLAQKPQKPHAAFLHCAEPQGLYVLLFRASTGSTAPIGQQARCLKIYS